MPGTTSRLLLRPRLRRTAVATLVAAVTRRRPGHRPRSATPSPRACSTADLAGGGDGVEAAIDVEHLAGRGREPVRHQGDARLGDGFGIAQVPAERRPLRPDVLETVEAGDAAGRDRAQGPG